MIKLSFNRFLFYSVLITLLAFLQYRLWFSSDGIQDMWRLKNAIHSQSERNQQLKKNNEALVFQIKRSQNNPAETESRARNELGMIKKGEVFYQIVK